MFSSLVEKTGKVDQRPVFKVNNMKEKTKKDIDEGIEDLQKGVRGGVKAVQKGARDVGDAVDKEVKKMQKRMEKS
jgi:tryptophanyl-tRNA synthetase